MIDAYCSAYPNSEKRTTAAAGPAGSGRPGALAARRQTALDATRAGAFPAGRTTGRRDGSPLGGTSGRSACPRTRSRSLAGDGRPGGGTLAVTTNGEPRPRRQGHPGGAGLGIDGGVGRDDHRHQIAGSGRTAVRSDQDEQACPGAGIDRRSPNIGQGEGPGNHPGQARSGRRGPGPDQKKRQAEPLLGQSRPFGQGRQPGRRPPGRQNTMAPGPAPALGQGARALMPISTPSAPMP